MPINGNLEENMFSLHFFLFSFFFYKAIKLKKSNGVFDIYNNNQGMANGLNSSYNCLLFVHCDFVILPKVCILVTVQSVYINYINGIAYLAV